MGQGGTTTSKPKGQVDQMCTSKSILGGAAAHPFQSAPASTAGHSNDKECVVISTAARIADTKQGSTNPGAASPQAGQASYPVATVSPAPTGSSTHRTAPPGTALLLQHIHTLHGRGQGVERVHHRPTPTPLPYPHPEQSRTPKSNPHVLR